MTRQIKKVDESDLDEILSLFKNTIESTCIHDYSSQQISAWTSSVQNKTKWINKIKTQFFVKALSGQTIIGFGSLADDYIDMLYVHKDFLKKGVATSIFDSLKIKAKQNSFDQLLTHASITAVPFFTSKGFSVVKENRLFLHGVEIINFEMKLINLDE